MFAFIMHLPISMYYTFRQRPDIAGSNWSFVYSCNRHDAPGSRDYEDLVSGFKLVDSNALRMTSNLQFFANVKNGLPRNSQQDTYVGR